MDYTRLAKLHYIWNKRYKQLKLTQTDSLKLKLEKIDIHLQIYNTLLKKYIRVMITSSFRAKHATEVAALELVDRIISEMDNDEPLYFSSF